MHTHSPASTPRCAQARAHGRVAAWPPGRVAGQAAMSQRKGYRIVGAQRRVAARRAPCRGRSVVRASAVSWPGLPAVSRHNCLPSPPWSQYTKLYYNTVSPAASPSYVTKQHVLLQYTSSPALPAFSLSHNTLSVLQYNPIQLHT